MARRTASQISFHLEGSRQDGGLVRVNDFVEWLEHVWTCLRRLERERRDAVETVYRVAKLSAGSAVITVEARSEADRDVTARHVAQNFMLGIEGLQGGNLAKLPFDPETKSAFARLTGPLRRQLRSVTVASGAKRVKLQPAESAVTSFEPKIDSISVSSLSGFVDALNVHNDPVFYLYPTIGPNRIPCVFDPSLLDEIRAAIKRYTTVYGAFEYASGSPFPERIVTERVEVNPPLSELPTLRSLFGAAPSLSGGVDAVSFIRRQRDAEP